MGVAWLITLPAAALVGAVAFGAAQLIGGTLGVIVVFAAAAIFAGLLYLASRKTAVHAGNVNDEWVGRGTPTQVGTPV